jgi:hypothetical protein
VAHAATQRLVENETAALQSLSRGERLFLNELLRKVAALAGLDVEAGDADDDVSARGVPAQRWRSPCCGPRSAAFQRAASSSVDATGSPRSGPRWPPLPAQGR